MNRSRRLLLLVAAIVAVSLAAAGCDSSPYAAIINGKVIKQTALQAELRGRVSNTAYVKALDQSGSQSGEAVEGQAPGSYSATFSVLVLNQLVESSAIHQYLAARHQLPSPSALAAARAIEEIQFASAWQAFPVNIRDEMVSDLADRAAIEPTPAKAAVATAHKVVAANQAYFFARVCTRLITVTVPGANGEVNFAASKTQADQIQAAYGFNHSGGAVSCSTPAQLELSSPAMFNQVLGLAPGDAGTPQRTANGYTVLGVDSRRMQPITPGTVSVITYVLNSQSASSDDTPALVRVLAGAKVKVNPAFGSWDRSQLSVVVSGVPAELNTKLHGTTSQLTTQG